MVSQQGESKPLSEVVSAIENFVFFQSSMAVSDLTSHLVWYELVKNKPLLITELELDSFLDFYWNQTDSKTTLELPPEINFLERGDILPSVQISFSADKSSSEFAVQMSFNYQGNIVEANSGQFIYNLLNKEKIRRHLDAEMLALEELKKLGVNSSENPKIQGYFGGLKFLPAVEKMISLGWQVFAKDQRLQLASDFQISFSSGVDWFDLNAEVTFGKQILQLPQLLLALKNRQRMIMLGDGSVGLLPEAWLNRFSKLASVAKTTDNGLRLSKVQALFLSASLDENDKVAGDIKFENLRRVFLDLQNLKAQTPDKLFKGKLRDYQKLGLAWLEKMSENNLGAILADDMGLGKTIQILALLSGQNSRQRLPSLVLAPKSLIFNWQKEAINFAPHLKILIYTGSNRQSLLAEIPEKDLILTTYHTLRNDIDFFQKQKFNFLILDEAHNLKNARSQVTMAAKLVRADKKIALTGTPIENSLMDLFSILSVVNPGLVTETQSQRWTKQNSTDDIQHLNRALRPFLMRRTKEQVLKDLPAKSEQVLYCELSDNEKKKYDELKNFYWAQLTGKIEQKGLAKSRIEVLEALLRLRQAACHQGLLDKKFAHLPSAKFELVLEQLETVIRDGHKALVFSQFTSLLSLFAARLSGINYEYLDGKTENRAEKVENFQTNENCQVFLLSLKAGGVGLNLTAADYVFILDPWWNPAAESQAIDRAHRIGQTKKVFAYKIIAKDTVEEKILALQEKKKNLAKSIISDDASLFKNMKFEDLQALFE